MKKLHLLLTLLSLFAFYSCSKDPINSTTSDFTNGFFMLNEGSFSNGNASLDFYNYKKDSLYPNIFKSINNTPIGDVAQELKLINGKYALVVNNSNKIYWLNKETLKIIDTTLGIPFPRYIETLSSTQAIVSSMNGQIYIVNSNTGSIENTIQTHQFTERIIVNNSDIIVEFKKMYTSSLPDSQGFMIFDKSNLSLKKTIYTSLIPEGSKLMNNKIYSFYSDPKFVNNSEFTSIDLNTFTFKNYSKNNAAGSKALIFPYNNTLIFYDNNEIKQIDGNDLISSLVKNCAAMTPYALGVDSEGDILLGDAKDFVHSSSVNIYSNSGLLKKSISTGIGISVFY